MQSKDQHELADNMAAADDGGEVEDDGG